MKMQAGILATACCLVIVLVDQVPNAKADDESTNDELNKSTAQLARLRGFEAEDHYVNITSGNIINVVRIRHPTAKPTKEPVLCVHGILSSASLFILNSVDARPKDYSNLNAGNMTIEELERLIGDDPTTRSMCLTMVNFGHECWLMNRRGTLQSLGTTNHEMRPFLDESFKATYMNRSNLYYKPGKNILSSVVDSAAAFRDGVKYLNDLRQNINPKYWDFAADEQSDFDLPEVIDYILLVTGLPKLSLVTHSLGGTIFLQSLIKKGKSLEDKILKGICYAPSFYQGDVVRLNPLLAAASTAAEPFLVGYVGPVPPPVSVRITQSIVSMFCQSDFEQENLCEPVADILFGPSGGQTPIKPGYFNTVLDSESSHQLALVSQTIQGNRTRYFDYLLPPRNLQKYGSIRSPYYDVSKITFPGLSFWAGVTDFLVPAVNTMQLATDIPAPVDTHLIGNDTTFFNHISHFFHDRVASLLTIPSLKSLETATRSSN